MNNLMIILSFTFIMKLSSLFMSVFIWALFLELIMVMVFLFMVKLSWTTSLLMVFMFLYIMVIEGSIALAIISKSSHVFGNELMNI